MALENYLSTQINLLGLTAAQDNEMRQSPIQRAADAGAMCV
jgi:hypothetical protein